MTLSGDASDDWIVNLVVKGSAMRVIPLSKTMRWMLTTCLSCGAWQAGAKAVDIAAAGALAKFSNCTKCHSVDKKKDDPSFIVTATKYRAKPDAEARLIKHITTGPKVKIDDVEEEHQIVKTKDDAEIRNLVRFILSR